MTETRCYFSILKTLSDSTAISQAVFDMCPVVQVAHCQHFVLVVLPLLHSMLLLPWL
jgi:hypothetical protein